MTFKDNRAGGTQRKLIKKKKTKNNDPTYDLFDRRERREFRDIQCKTDF